MGSRQRHLRPRQPRERALILYRPVGLEELRLVYESDLKAFPPRLAEQPIFYPVLNEPYATQIARDWNTKSSNAAGYVTQFEVDDAFVQRYEVQQVGAREHVELWVPAEELSRFNEHIVPPIRVISAYFGEAFHGLIPTVGGFAGRNAVEQFVMLDALLEHARFDFWYEVAVNQAAVFLHFPFWAQRDFSAEGITAGRRAHVLSAITERWSDGFAERPLPQCRPGPPGPGVT